ncbi:hypothetical protein TZ03_11515 [Pseudomonas sp. 10-1B]|uniref:hypothetical protein n=1 Tax=Pseudomonas sp. 10-1B TaxID=1546029 RepID=UPI00061E9DF0|nr:hypothetical protein [Pseudomonas sp. 10-1B]KIY40759.1 hypothetical protein TZ03_11515 [Pseudomonas sp. 10-1B]
METKQLIAHDSYFGYAGEPLHLCFDRLTLRHDSVKVVLDKLPYLKSSVTGQVFFTAPAVHIIETEVTHAKSQGKEKTTINQFVRFNRRKLPIASDTNFKYSLVEHFFIPGLIRNIPSDGYLTPVYFNQDVLIKFEYSGSCDLLRSTPTSGLITTKDNVQVPYGINSSGSVVMWLGDIVNLSEKEHLYLYSENIDPQYDLHSDFYRNQILGEWLG